jgi:alpha-mannosidase
MERPSNGEEEPGQRWVDVSGRLARGPATDEVFGLAVLNDGKYGFDVLGAEIGVTAVRSPIFAHHEPAVPQAGTRYAYQDQGIQRFTLALLPHRGAWTEAGLTRRALELNQRPTVLIESAHDGPLPPTASYASVTPDNVVLGAFKLAEDADDLVVRAIETSGRGASTRIDLPAWQRHVQFEIAPYEIRTFRVPRDPRLPVTETDLLERPLGEGERVEAATAYGADAR